MIDRPVDEEQSNTDVTKETPVTVPEEETGPVQENVTPPPQSDDEGPKENLLSVLSWSSLYFEPVMGESTRPPGQAAASSQAAGEGRVVFEPDWLASRDSSDVSTVRSMNDPNSKPMEVSTSPSELDPVKEEAADHRPAMEPTQTEAQDTPLADPVQNEPTPVSTKIDGPGTCTGVSKEVSTGAGASSAGDAANKDDTLPPDPESSSDPADGKDKTHRKKNRRTRQASAGKKGRVVSFFFPSAIQATSRAARNRSVTSSHDRTDDEVPVVAVARKNRPNVLMSAMKKIKNRVGKKPKEVRFASRPGDSSYEQDQGETPTPEASVNGTANVVATHEGVDLNYNQAATRESRAIHEQQKAETTPPKLGRTQTSQVEGVGPREETWTEGPSGAHKGRIASAIISSTPSQENKTRSTRSREIKGPIMLASRDRAAGGAPLPRKNDDPKPTKKEDSDDSQSTPISANLSKTQSDVDDMAEEEEEAIEVLSVASERLQRMRSDPGNDPEGASLLVVKGSHDSARDDEDDQESIVILNQASSPSKASRSVAKGSVGQQGGQRKMTEGQNHDDEEDGNPKDEISEEPAVSKKPSTEASAGGSTVELRKVFSDASDIWTAASDIWSTTSSSRRSFRGRPRKRGATPPGSECGGSVLQEEEEDPKEETAAGVHMTTSTTSEGSVPPIRGLFTAQSRIVTRRSSSDSRSVRSDRSSSLPPVLPRNRRKRRSSRASSSQRGTESGSETSRYDDSASIDSVTTTRSELDDDAPDVIDELAAQLPEDCPWLEMGDVSAIKAELSASVADIVCKAVKGQWYWPFNSASQLRNNAGAIKEY